MGAARARRTRTAIEPADTPLFGPEATEKHRGLRKHESSVLTQLRTGKIGLRAFLFQRRVPDVPTPLCRCGTARETPEHLALDCPDEEEGRAALRRAIAPRALRTSRDFAEATADPETAGQVVRWFLELRERLPEFRLAEEIRAEDEEAARTRRGRAASE